ncbi:MAG: tyrosine-protein phosphatase [Chloroflexi bacterium]|nr:tyrosine-protein phosphatase [Chloroflexota bacterium]
MSDPPEGFERRIEFERVTNFRDLGGYETREGQRVRWRSVFRSSTLSQATPADVQRLLGLDLALVLDLRTNDELERSGISALHEHGVEHRHVPYGVVSMRDRAGPGLDYLRGIDQAVLAIGTIFAAIAGADEDRAVAFNCEGGKDRTGVTSALLLRTLGVPDETIVEDYALTREYLTLWRDLSDEQVVRRGEQWGTELTREMLDAAPATMQSLLRGIDDRFGSTEALLALGGVDEPLIARLRERLLED